MSVSFLIYCCWTRHLSFLLSQAVDHFQLKDWLEMQRLIIPWVQGEFGKRISRKQTCFFHRKYIYNIKPGLIDKSYLVAVFSRKQSVVLWNSTQLSSLEPDYADHEWKVFLLITGHWLQVSLSYRTVKIA